MYSQSQNLLIRQPVQFSSLVEDVKQSNVLVLHGFLQKAEKFLTSLKPCFDLEKEKPLSLQAPFPVFRERPERYAVGYSWFFYDPKTKEYLVDRYFGIHFCIQVLQQLKIDHQVETVIGYSQGGYLAPFVAKQLPNVKQVIGIHARFRHEDLNDTYKFQLNQLHGADDAVVDPVEAEKSHQYILQNGNRGVFKKLNGIGHEMNEKVHEGVRHFLDAQP